MAISQFKFIVGKQVPKAVVDYAKVRSRFIINPVITACKKNDSDRKEEKQVNLSPHGF